MRRREPAPEPRADGGVEEGGPGHHDARRVRRRALRVQQVAVQQIRTEPQCDAAPNAEPSGVRIRRQFRRRARALCEPARHAGQNERAHQCAAWRLGIAAAAGAAAADQPTPTSWKADVDYKGGSFCAGGSYIGGGLLQGHYLQSVTESLALGAEGLYHVHRPITGLTGVARCVWGGKGDNVLTAKSSTLGSHELAYSRKVGLERSARARARSPALHCRTPRVSGRRDR